MIGPRFGERVESAHTCLSRSNFETIYVVGDVHGCISELRQLWGLLDPGPSDLVVFVGDLVRKGPASDAVVEFVRTRENAHSVRGNNEEMIIREEASAGLSDANRHAIERFPLVVSWEDATVVHGGVDPDRQFEAHEPTDLLEMRARPPERGYDGPFWFDAYVGPPRVYFGHTVLKQPLVEEWCVGLDTGCVHGGHLTAFNCRTGTSVSVAAERTYAPRSEHRILNR